MAKVPKTVIPNLSNATPEGLTDQLGKIRQEIKVLEKEKDLLSEALKGRARGLEQNGFVGEEYYSEIVEMSRSGLDTDRIKADMGEEWVEQYTKTTTYTQINCKPVVKA